MIARWDLPDAVIYCDPPYDGPERLRAPSGSTGGARGYRFDTTPDLWPRLVDALLEVRHATVLLSGYPCAEAERLGWEPLPLPALRTAQAGRGSVGRAPEVVWSNRPLATQITLDALAVGASS